MIKPLGERVVIEVSESDVKTASGIVLPDTAKEKPQKGTVVAVGSGKLLENGERAAMEVCMRRRHPTRSDAASSKDFFGLKKFRSRPYMHV